MAAVDQLGPAASVLETCWVIGPKRLHHRTEELWLCR
jgi:hypothetical protein